MATPAASNNSTDQQGNRVRIKRRRRKRPCPFCVDKVSVLDHNDASRVRRFVTDRGKIMPRRNSGVCARHQRVVADAVKRARYIGLLSYTIE